MCLLVASSYKYLHSPKQTLGSAPGESQVQWDDSPWSTPIPASPDSLFKLPQYVCTSGPILPSNPTGLQANSTHQPLLVLFKHHQLAPFWSPFPSLSWTHSQLLQPLFNPTAATLVQAFIYLSLENCKGFLNTGLSPVITIMPQAIHCPTCRINTVSLLHLKWKLPQPARWHHFPFLCEIRMLLLTHHSPKGYSALPSSPSEQRILKEHPN